MLNDEIINIREITHGDFETNVETLYKFLDVVENTPNYCKLSNVYKECLHMILLKISRSLCGDENNNDNTTDIIGYAKLLQNHINKTNKNYENK